VLVVCIGSAALSSALPAHPIDLPASLERRTRGGLVTVSNVHKAEKVLKGVTKGANTASDTVNSVSDLHSAIDNARHPGRRSLAFDEIDSRDLLDDFLTTRDFDDNIFEREVGDEIWARDFLTDLDSRDFDDELSLRNLEERSIADLVHRLDTRGKEKKKEPKQKAPKKEKKKQEKKKDKKKDKKVVKKVEKVKKPNKPKKNRRDLDELSSRDVDVDLFERGLEHEFMDDIAAREFSDVIASRDVEGELSVRGLAEFWEGVKSFFTGKPTTPKPTTPTPTPAATPAPAPDSQDSQETRAFFEDIDTREINELD